MLLVRWGVVTFTVTLSRGSVTDTWCPVSVLESAGPMVTVCPEWVAVAVATVAVSGMSLIQCHSTAGSKSMAVPTLMPRALRVGSSVSTGLAARVMVTR